MRDQHAFFRSQVPNELAQVFDEMRNTILLNLLRFLCKVVAAHIQGHCLMIFPKLLQLFFPGEPELWKAMCKEYKRPCALGYVMDVNAVYACGVMCEHRFVTFPK